MALKTFNVDAEAYDKFSKHCKKEGISMSKQIENFIKNEIEKLEKNPSVDLSKIDQEVLTKSVEHTFKKYC